MAKGAASSTQKCKDNVFIGQPRCVEWEECVVGMAMKDQKNKKKCDVEG